MVADDMANSPSARKQMESTSRTTKFGAPEDAARWPAPYGYPSSRRRTLILVCINLSNLACHSVYSVLAAFFPQEAKLKGLTEEMVGLIFAIFAAVIFVSAPFASMQVRHSGPGDLLAPRPRVPLVCRPPRSKMTKYGKRRVYVTGLAIVATGTMLFAGAEWLTSISSYFGWCFLLRCVQGFGSALEETAAYGIIAEVDPDAVSFNLGMTEISTGLGYMIGPTIGGILFSMGGFITPFICIGVALVPAMILVMLTVPDDSKTKDDGMDDADEEPALPIRALISRPQILAVAMTAVLGTAAALCVRLRAAPRLTNGAAAASRQLGLRLPRAHPGVARDDHRHVEHDGGHPLLHCIPGVHPRVTRDGVVLPQAAARSPERHRRRGGLPGHRLLPHRAHTHGGVAGLLAGDHAHHRGRRPGALRLGRGHVHDASDGGHDVRG